MPTILHHGRKLKYQVHATARLKTLALKVHRDGVIEVRAPKFIKLAQLRQFVVKRAEWILHKQRYFADLRKKYPPKEFKNGETFPVLGRNHRLKIERQPGLHKPICELSGWRLKVIVNGHVGEELQRELRSSIRDWYTALTEKKARAVLRKHTNALAVRPGKLRVVNQAKRWASCSKNGDIRCNWRLSMMPMPVLEYIVVHELCHLRTHDHSERFWRILKSVLPDYQRRREWLRREGAALLVGGEL